MLIHTWKTPVLPHPLAQSEHVLIQSSSEIAALCEATEAWTTWVKLYRKHFECILLSANRPIFIKKYFRLVSDCPTDNKSTFIQITIWCTTYHNHLSELMLASFHGCIYYSDVIMSAMASQIASLDIVYSTVYSGADQRKHQSSASLAIGRGIHWWPVNSTRKWPVTWKMFPFDDVIVNNRYFS